MTDWTPIATVEEAEGMDETPTVGSEVNLHDVVCGDCGEPMDVHGCPNGASHPAPAPTVVTTRSTGPRKKADEHPPCVHCGGRIHWNNGAALVNFECMYRQYLLSEGKISDPSARLPVFTADTEDSFHDYVQQQRASGTFSYGNMESSGGGGSTYSSIRPKAPPKPVKTEEEKAAAKTEAAARRKAMKAAKSITDVATDVAGAESFDTLGGEELGVSVPPAEADLEPAEAAKAPRKSRSRAPTAESNGSEASAPTSLEEGRAKRREERQKRLREMQTT